MKRLILTLFLVSAGTVSLAAPANAASPPPPPAIPTCDAVGAWTPYLPGGVGTTFNFHGAVECYGLPSQEHMVVYGLYRAHGDYGVWHTLNTATSDTPAGYRSLTTSAVCRQGTNDYKTLTTVNWNYVGYDRRESAVVTKTC